MKKLINYLLILTLLYSCSKQTPTLVYATLTKGHDYMPYGLSQGCYGGWYEDFDTVFVYFSNTPDTGALHVESWMHEIPTGRVDSSFVFAGETVYLTGPILSREFRKLKSINKIVYGTP